MKNKGFSLIELIVVIAVLGVVVTMSSATLVSISKANAHSCAEKMNAAIELTRTNAMTREGNPSIEIYTDSNGDIYVHKSWDEPELIGSNRISVQITVDGTVSDLPLNTTPLVLSFNKGTGGFVTGLKLSEITVTSGGRTYTIKCYPLTGRTVLE